MIEPGRNKIRLIYLIEMLMLPIRLIFNRTSIKETEVNKVLVLELWGIGDVVLATGFLSNLRERYPSSEIHVLAKGYAKTILENHSSNVIVRDFSFPWTTGLEGKYRIWQWPWKEIITLIKKLRNEKFDYSVESRGDIRNHLLMLFIGAKESVGFNFGLGWLLDIKVKIPSKNSHRTEDWKVVADAIHCESNQKELELNVSQIEKTNIANKLGLNSQPWIGLHIAASNKSKQWPLQSFEKLINKIALQYTNIPILVFIDPTGFGHGLSVPNSVVLARNLSLRELMAGIANCRMLIALDGGPMHIGAALGIPVISLFGPTLETWFGPVGASHVVITESVCEYRPCFDYCKYDTPRCIEAISVERVMSEVNNLLNVKESD